MTSDLMFYTNPMSRGRIVRWMLEETGADYAETVLDYGTTMKGADYLAINPMGKVPAIRHGDQLITECAAICAYLADAFPEAGLAPALDRRGARRRGPSPDGRSRRTRDASRWCRTAGPSRSGRPHRRPPP